MHNNISNVIQLCDQHIFQQTKLVQNILNICSELTGISGCDKHCNKIIAFCNRILAVTYQNTHSIIKICHDFSDLKHHADDHSELILSPMAKDKTSGKIVQEETILVTEFLTNEIKLKDPSTLIKCDFSAKDSQDSDSDQTINVVDDLDWSHQFSKTHKHEKEDDQNDFEVKVEKDGNKDKQIIPIKDSVSNQKLKPDEKCIVWDPECQPDPRSTGRSELKHKQKKVNKVKNKEYTSKINTDEEFPCIFCRLKLKSAEARSKHEAKHQCEICGQIFQIGQKKRHHLKHTGERNFVCDVCGSKFATNYRLQYHKINVHQVERPFPCDQCTYTAKSAELLRRHKKAHSNVKNYLCTDCGACFKNLYDLKLHTVTHKDVWPFCCELCSKRFKTKDRLQRHDKTHKDSYSYECKICGKKMHQSGNLTTHMRTHTGDKPYKCGRCGKGFAHNVTRKQHEQVCYGSANMSASDSFSANSHLKHLSNFAL